MKTSSALCLLALAAPILARPKYQPPYSDEVSSSSQEPDGYGQQKTKSGSYAPTNTYTGAEYEPSEAPSYVPTLTGGYLVPTSTPAYRGSGSGSGSGGSPTGGSGGGTPTGGLGSPSGTANGTSSSSNGTVSSGSVSLPAGCESLNGIGIGWLPDSDISIPLTTITSALGNVKPCFAGYYAQITSSSSWDGSQLTGHVNEVKAGGTPYPIFVASVMPSIPFSEVPSVAADVASVMNQLTSEGLTVWLRFAHEMNYYVTDGTYHGSASDYQTAWAAISKAVAGNDNVKMFWSPNSDSAASLKSAGWYPTSGAVDVIGVDIYPNGEKSFGDVYGDFCDGWPNTPFAIGETGSGGSSADKTYWLQQLTSTGAKTACPNYVGFSYFEYNKDGTDFDVATNGNNEAESVFGSS
ncbi:hypothetical protein MMC28_007616 [Mycoblastus sanguinarius]|nr:hypothetical protein [Mycoblastus sanguinarius]